jgi:hypothetical protein
VSDLEYKWTSIREAGDTVEAYSLTQATPESFVLVFNDRGGDGPCAVDITAVGAFGDVADCLAYLRYYELHEMLEWRATFEQGHGAPEPDEAIDMLEAGLAADVEALASALTAAIDSHPDAEQLEALRSMWNEAFALTNPGSTIEAWGSVTQVIASPYGVELLLDEDFEGEYEELVEAARSGLFDLADPVVFERALEALGELERL